MEKYYQKMLNYIHQRPRLKKIIIDIFHYFPYIPFCMYPCLLFFLFLNQNHKTKIMINYLMVLD